MELGHPGVANGTQVVDKTQGIVQSIGETAIRCEHGNKMAVVTSEGISIRHRDGCQVTIPWFTIRVVMEKKLP